MRVASLVAGIIIGGIGVGGLYPTLVTGSLGIVAGRVPDGITAISIVLVLIGLVLFFNGFRSSMKKPSEAHDLSEAAVKGAPPPSAMGAMGPQGPGVWVDCPRGPVWIPGPKP